MAITVDKTTHKYPIGTVIIDGYRFDKIGYGMLQTSNTLNYFESPKRSNSGTLFLDNYDSYIVPECEIGFSLISIEDFMLLRKVLLSRKEHFVDYFDVDFGIRVKHRMMVEEDKLKAFFSLGSKIIGLQNFTIKFTSTLSPWEAYTVRFNANGGEVKNFNSLPAFELGVGYAVDDTVKEGNKIYLCTAAHTPTESNGITVTDTSYWRHVDISPFKEGKKMSLNEQFKINDNSDFIKKANKRILSYCDAVDENGAPKKNAIYFYIGDIVTVDRDFMFYAVWGD